jgi:DNA polymerase-3 subunit epsilon
VIKLFNLPILQVPMVWIDTETTGFRAGVDRVVQLGIARFQPGSTDPTIRTWFVNPGGTIPEVATAIHGITDAMVTDAPPLSRVMVQPELAELLDGAQPGAYNAGFDRGFLPGLTDHTWPWLDSLTIVRKCDRYVRGKGRHKLEATCERHGIPLASAHDAGQDAAAAGRLFIKLVSGAKMRRELPQKLGDLLLWLELERAREWHRFSEWLSQQPSQEEEAATA